MHRPLRGGALLRIVFVGLLLLAVAALLPPAQAAKGDDATTGAAGYVWTNRVAGGKIYNWENGGSNAGIGTYGGAASLTFPTGFDFTYYGTDHGAGSTMYMGEDGLVGIDTMWGGRADTALNNRGQFLPDTADPNNYVAPFYYPQYYTCTNPPATVTLNGVGSNGNPISRENYVTSGPHNRWILSWINFAANAGGTNAGCPEAFTYQVKFFDDTDIMEFQYQDAHSLIMGGSGCFNHLVGIEDGSGTKGLRISFDASGGCATSFAAASEGYRIWKNEDDDAMDQTVVVARDSVDNWFTLNTSNDPLYYYAPVQNVMSGASLGSFPAAGNTKYAPDDVKYTPAPAFNGTDSFQYKVEDGYNNPDTATVTFYVNEYPVAVNDTLSVDASDTPQAQVLRVLDNDFDWFYTVANTTGGTADHLEVSELVSTPSKGTAVVSLDKKTITYTPNAGAAGTDTFQYNVTDGMLNDTATVTIVINQAPKAVDDTKNATGGDILVDAGQAILIDVLANDLDAYYSNRSGAVANPQLTITAVSAATHGTPSIEPGATKVRFTALATGAGQDTFTYNLTDGRLNSTANVTLLVNAQPVAVNDTLFISEGETGLADILDNDSDAYWTALGALQIDDAGTPANGDASIVGGQLQYIPDAGYVGFDELTYTISDGRLSATAVLNITVNAVPVALNDTLGMDQDGPAVDVAVLDNDSDAFYSTLSGAVTNASLSIVAVDTPASGTATIQGNVIRFTPALGYFGHDEFTYTVSDGIKEVSAWIIVDIDEVLFGPNVTLSTPFEILEGGTAAINATHLLGERDGVDPADIVFAIVNAPLWGQALLDGTPIGVGDTFTQQDIDDDRLAYRHGGGELATDTMRLSASDGVEAKQKPFPITVLPVNDPPVASTGGTIIVPADFSVVLTTSHLNVADPDDLSGALTWTVATPPTKGAFQLSGNPLPGCECFPHTAVGGALTYKHLSGDGADSAVLRVADAAGATSTITLNFDIQGVNEPPELIALGDLTVAQGSAVKLTPQDLMATDDRDGAAGIRYMLPQPPVHGAVLVDGLPVEAGQWFTQADVNAGRVKYFHDGSPTIADAIVFMLQDTTDIYPGTFSVGPFMLPVTVLEGTTIDDDVDVNGDKVPDRNVDCEFLALEASVSGDYTRMRANLCPPFDVVENETDDPPAATEPAAGTQEVDTTLADFDKDGIPDNADNCPSVPNELQEDMDRDGRGNVCDDDIDGDGVLQVGDGIELDNCPLEPNGNQLDSDGDGVGDACDTTRVVAQAEPEPAGKREAVVLAGSDPAPAKTFGGLPTWAWTTIVIVMVVAGLAFAGWGVRTAFAKK